MAAGKGADKGVASSDGKIYIAEYDFAGEQEEDLSFSEKDKILLLEELDENWWRGRLLSSGAEGVFPKGFVKLVEEIVETEETVPEPSQTKDEKAPLSVEIDTAKVYYIAEYDFEATEESDLGFVTGEIIEELEQLDSEWFRGRIGEREGMFPSAYVTLYQGESATEPTQTAEAEEKDAEEGEKYVAAYDYESEEAGDLTFSAGEVIEVLEKVDDSWWKGKIGDREGIFPATFVELQ